MIKSIGWMRAANGSLQHVTNVRFDVRPAVNMCSRYSHRPDAQAIKSTKHIIFHLLATPDVGLTYGAGPNTVWTDLQWSRELPKDFKFDPKVKMLGYHIGSDGALSIDRSISGIVHMFGGAAISGQSFRQHSQAVDAYGSETFTCSTAAAQNVPFRGIMTELGIKMMYPTPCFVDNESTVLVSESRASLKRSMHLMRRAKYMVEQTLEEAFKALSVAGHLNFADPFTKAILEHKVYLLHRAYYMGE